MLNLQCLFRGRSEWNWGAAHIFWHMMDEHIHIIHRTSSTDYVFAWLPWTFPQMCLYHFRIPDLRSDWKRYPQQDKALRGIQTVDDPTVEPTPSEKHCKREVLNIVGLQMISRDTQFLWCRADRQSVLRAKRLLNMRFVNPSFGWNWSGEQWSREVRLESRIGELEEQNKLWLCDFWC